MSPPSWPEPTHATFRALDERLDAYAGLLIELAVNLAPGQELLIDAQLAQAPLVRALTEAAYAAGAHYVDVQYLDRRVRRAFVDGAPDDVLGWTPPWMLARLERAIELGSAVIGISADSGADVVRGRRRGAARAGAPRRARRRVDARGDRAPSPLGVGRLSDGGVGARGLRQAGPGPPLGGVRARAAPGRARPRAGLAHPAGRARGARRGAHRAGLQRAALPRSARRPRGRADRGSVLAGRRRDDRARRPPRPQPAHRGGVHQPAPAARGGPGGRL